MLRVTKFVVSAGVIVYNSSIMAKKWTSKKSWREKLENPPEGLPKVVNGPASWEKRFGGR